MKILTIVRHGKSSWNHDVSDLDRPLKKRGIADVTRVSKEYVSDGLIPEAVFSSPAKRAFDTCNIFLNRKEFSYIKVNVFPQLYDFAGNNLINFIKSLDDKYQHVMIFGHNYAMTNFVNTYGDVFIDNFPTSGLAVFEFDIEYWKDLKPGKTITLLLPKDLR